MIMWLNGHVILCLNSWIKNINLSASQEDLLQIVSDWKIEVHQIEN